MKASDLKQTIGNWISSMDDNPLLVVVLVIAALLVALILGGLLLDTVVQKRRNRAKIKAVERLQKHLQSLPSGKS